MNMHVTTSTEEAPTYPETAAGPQEADDARQLAPESEEGDPEEAGYGYGV